MAQFTAGYTFPVLNSDGTFSSTKNDFDDVFVKKDYFDNGGMFVSGINNGGGGGALGLGSGASYAVSSPTQIGNLNTWRCVSTGAYWSAAIRSDGTLWTWGEQSWLDGTLGLGDLIDRSSPVQVGSLTDWKLVACSQYAGRPAVRAIKTDGSLWGWSSLLSGKASSPVQIGTDYNWKYVVCSGSTTFGIKTDGSLWAGGNGNGGFLDGGDGKLGLGDIISRSSMIQVGTLTDWNMISCNQYISAAVKTNGSLWTWGKDNIFGMLGNGVLIGLSSPVQVGLLTNWKTVSCGNYNVMGIRTDGTLWTWGDLRRGQAGIIVTSTRVSSPVQVGSLTNWKLVVAADSASHAIKTDGTLWAWGQSPVLYVSTSSPVQVGTLNTWKSIAVGTYALVFLGLISNT